MTHLISRTLEDFKITSKHQSTTLCQAQTCDQTLHSYRKCDCHAGHTILPYCSHMHKQPFGTVKHSDTHTAIQITKNA